MVALVVVMKLFSLAHVSKTEAHGCRLLHQHLLIDIILQVSLHCAMSSTDWNVHSVLDWTTYERFNRAAPVGGNGDHASSMFCLPYLNLMQSSFINLHSCKVCIHFHRLPCVE